MWLSSRSRCPGTATDFTPGWRDVGLQIQVPRDSNGTFESQLVKKRQRRLSDMDQMVLSLFAKGADDR